MKYTKKMVLVDCDNLSRSQSLEKNVDLSTGDLNARPTPLIFLDSEIKSILSTNESAETKLKKYFYTLRRFLHHKNEQLRPLAPPPTTFEFKEQDKRQEDSQKEEDKQHGDEKTNIDVSVDGIENLTSRFSRKRKSDSQGDKNNEFVIREEPKNKKCRRSQSCNSIQTGDIKQNKLEENQQRARRRNPTRQKKWLTLNYK
jgi:hypothetical protein